MHHRIMHQRMYHLAMLLCLGVGLAVIGCSDGERAVGGPSDEAAEALKVPPPVDDPQYQAAKSRYDQRVRRRNAELVHQLDLTPADATKVEELLNSAHAARLAGADQPHAAVVNRSPVGASIRDLIGTEKAEQLQRLRENDGPPSRLVR